MNANEQPWVEVVRQRAAGLRFGTIQITIHDGRVTQVDATEKTRLPVESEGERLRAEEPPDRTSPRLPGSRK
jgi:hypothetical protein